ncbi:MAG: hypothetical protein JRI25_07070 [Deltaproteobacteria bacterium]|nr:hypothetical protein [Deltaproteobacteria bacterium]
MNTLLRRHCPMLAMACLMCLVLQAPEARADAWNATNNPERFQIDLQYDLAAMPVLGAADQIPWTLGYPPKYGDEPGLSTLVKFDQAVYDWGDVGIGNPDQLGPAAGSDYDISRQAQPVLGLDSNLPDPLEDRWGLYHGWAAAAVMEPEPISSVTYNGYGFTADDVKALAIRLYDQAPSDVVGAPCPEDVIPSDDPLGSHGVCQDINAGAFFVVLTNMLGKYKRGLPEGGDPGPGVFTRIASDYQIVEDRPLTEDEAVAILGHPGSRYGDLTGSPDSVKWYRIKMKVGYITESSNTTSHTEEYELILELNGDGDVIGGEWAGRSVYSHPDFVWIPTSVAQTNSYLTTHDVDQLIESAKDGPRMTSKLAAHVDVVARATATLAERTETYDPADLPPEISDNLLRAADSASEALDDSIFLLLDADDASGHERRVLGLRAAARLRHAMAQIRAFEAQVHGGMNGRHPRIAEEAGLGLMAYSEQLIELGNGIADVVVDMAHSESRGG